MKIYKILTGITLSIILISCGGTAEKKHETQKGEVAHTQDKKKAEPKLSLNNGAKWAADVPTYDGMKAMRLAMTNFSTVHSDATKEEYNDLGKELGLITKEIIAKCSMKGPDHDQLHIVLAPMLANVGVIKTGGDIYETRKNVDGLEKHLNEFFDHFELK